MTKRNKILIIVIVIVLALAGYILYRGFFAGNPDQPDVSAIPTKFGATPGEVAPVAPILSKGTALDFVPVKKYNSQEQLFNYPKTNPDEVNLPLPDLIK